MRVFSALLVALHIVVVTVAHDRPSLNGKCHFKEMGHTACAIDRTNVLKCDGTRWVKSVFKGCLPGCCYQDHKHSSPGCFTARDGDCLYLDDADSDDDHPKTHDKGNREFFGHWRDMA